MLNPHLSAIDDLLCRLERLTALVWCAQSLAAELDNCDILNQALDEIGLGLTGAARELRHEWNALRDDLYGPPEKLPKSCLATHHPERSNITHVD